MLYTIDRIEKMVSAKGTEYHRADLSLEGTTELYVGVAIFGGFPTEKLVVGEKIDGELTTKEYKGKPSYTLNPIGSEKPKTASGGGFRQKMMEEAVERKNKAISGFQATKEEAIKMAGAQRDAVLIVTTFYKDEPLDEIGIKERITLWRDWLLSPDFTDKPPF